MTTPLWRPAGHYYSPIVDVDDVLNAADRLFERRVAQVAGVEPDMASAQQLMEVFTANGWLDDVPWRDEPVDGLRYHFDNDQFRHADALFYAYMLRHIRPRRVVEVGSGWSTCVLLDARDRWPEVAPQITAIDPDVSRLRARLGDDDFASLTLHEARVQDLPLEVFDSLAESDILFIDSSHVLKTASDVNHLIFEVLPRVPKGVWIHVHDVMWPFEYPRSWVQEGRSWNESYAWRAFLSFNETFRIQLWPTQLMALHEAWFHEHLPLALRDPGGSLWLRRVR